MMLHCQNFFFFLYFVKYSTHQKTFQVKVTDLNEIYILFRVLIIGMFSYLLKLRCLTKWHIWRIPPTKKNKPQWRCAVCSKHGKMTDMVYWWRPLFWLLQELPYQANYWSNLSRNLTLYWFYKTCLQDMNEIWLKF